jgi:hypothetical protein
MRLVIIGLISFSCSRWHNDADRLQLVCGPDVDPQKYSYVQVSESQPEHTDAILKNQGQWQALPVSSYGCLEVPRSIPGPVELAIRDRNSIQGRLLVLDPEASTQLLSTELTAEPSLRPEQIRLFCPSDPYVTQKRIALNRVAQPTRLLSKSLLRAELHDDQGRRVQQLTLSSEAASLNLDASLQEGLYQLKLISQDAFERDAPPLESSCQILLDRTAPVIRSSLSQEVYYDQSRNIRQLAPEAQITLDIEDASETVPAVCVKPYPANCLDEDFLPLRSLRAPGQGLWELQAYATDKAGQKSKLLRETFAVFQQSQVNSLQTLLSNVKFNLLLNQQPEAMATMLEASRIRALLQLEGERKAIQWAYVDTFWKLDQKINLIRSINVKTPIYSLIGSDWTDDFLVQGATGPAWLFRQDDEAATLERSVHADFSEGGKLWTLSGDGVLRYYDPQSLSRSFSTDMNSRATVAASPGGARAVVWTDIGQETLVRVYDRSAPGDDPIFKINLPKTLYQRVRYSFFGQDRYLIGRNNNKLLIWDSENDFAERSFNAPEGCLVQDYAVRSDQQIYMVSQKQRTSPSITIRPEESFCELLLIDLNNDSLKTSLNSRLPNVTNPNSLALSSDSGQNFLALSRVVGSALHLLDLNRQENNYLLNLDEGENAFSVSPLSEDRPVFFVSTSRRNFLLQITQYSTPNVYFSSPNLGSCQPQTLAQRLLCYQQDQPFVNIYSSALDRALQPTLFRSFTPNQSSDGGSQFLRASLLTKPLHAFVDQATRTIELQDEEKRLRASAKLKSSVSALFLHQSGRLAAGLQNGEIAVLEEGSELVLHSEDLEMGPIVDLLMTSDTVYALRKKSDGSYQLETLRFETSRLTRSNILSLPPGPKYSSLFFSERSSSGVVYQKDRGPITQEAVVFRKDGSEQTRVPMSVCGLNESRKGRGFYFVRDRSIFYYDFIGAREELIKSDLAYNACGFLEGEQLYALADFSGSLYAVGTDQKVADGLHFGLGPQGSIIVAKSNSELQLLSADGQTTYVKMPFNLPTQVDRILSDPDQTDIVLQYTHDFLGQGIKRLSTNQETIDARLRLWGQGRPG